MSPDVSVWPQDESHGLADIEIDWTDAANLAQAIYSPNDIQYVVEGLDFTPSSDYSSLTVSGGWAKIYKQTNSTLDHTDDQGVGQPPKTLLDGCHLVQTAQETGIVLGSGNVNHIWLEVDLSQSNSYNIYASDTEPTLPHIKLGTVDTGSQTYDDTVNDLPDAEFGDVNALSAQVESEPTDPTDVFRLQDYNPPNDTRTDVSDSSGVVVSETSDITFSSSNSASISVTADGDGSASIDVSSTDTNTDTHTGVSSGGTSVLAEVDDINFTGSSSVSDDGDGTVTIDTTDTNTDTHAGVSESGTSVLTDVSDINFSSNLNVSDDGDGSVTVNSIDTDTDTHTDVSDGKSQVLSDVGDINFGTALSVSDDGDGSVTIDGSDIQTDTDTHTSVSDDGSVIVSDVGDINAGSNIGVNNDGDGTVTLNTTDSVIQSSVEASSSALDIDISGDADTVDGHDVFVSSTEPSNGTQNDIWIEI